MIITGKPISVAIKDASSGLEIGPGEPFATGRPALTMASLAVILSPNNFSTSELGPIKTIPSSDNLLAKVGFSARKPYPGCTASAPTSLAAVTIASISKYDARGSSRGMKTDSSANLTGVEIRSSRP